MRQRLGMCRALMSSPMVLFLDEPTLGLDPIGKDEMLDDLARIAVEDGTCVVLCSHLLDEVERVCDRVGILHQGCKVADGAVDEVVAAAGVGGFGIIRVAVDDIGAAAEALHTSSAVGDIGFDNARPGDLRVRLTPGADGRADILHRLVDAGVDVRSFDLQGARLSDAFRALTAPKGHG
jgi:ABC-2 type transport system ATP-binding protein